MAKEEFKQLDYQNNYIKEKYERFEILAPKGTKAKASEAAAAKGLYNKRGLPNISEYVVKLIEADTGEKPFSECMNPLEDPET